MNGDTYMNDARLMAPPEEEKKKPHPDYKERIAQDLENTDDDFIIE